MKVDTQRLAKVETCKSLFSQPRAALLKGSFQDPALRNRQKKNMKPVHVSFGDVFFSFAPPAGPSFGLPVFLASGPRCGGKVNAWVIRMAK